MTEREKMIAGKLYRADKPEMVALRNEARTLMRQFNLTTEEQRPLRAELIEKLFGSVGRSVRMNPPFFCDYGFNIFVGDNFYANYHCVILDICPVTIGNHVWLAPNVSIFTAEHPIDAVVRNIGLESGRPVTIGDDVWIGGNTVINPGVTIGRNVVIGSGSVVTRDIPDNVIAVGNPCRVLREIGPQDKAYWENLQRMYEQEETGK